MKVIHAKSSWLNESNNRFDSKFYLGEGRVTRMLVTKSPLGLKTIEECTDRIFYGGRARRIYVKNKNNGIPYMGGASMQKDDFNDLKLISIKHTKGLDDYMLKEHWILVSRSGTVGSTVFTNGNFLGKAGSDDIIRIIPKSTVKPGVLFAYLSSKFGYSLFTQGAFGAVILHIEPDFIGDLPIPKFDSNLEKRINLLMLQSARAKEKSSSALASAHEMFEKNIFKGEDLHHSRIDTCNSSNVFKLLHTRLDASFYLNLLPIEKSFKTGLKSKTLGSLVKQPMFTSQRGRRVYVKKGIKFLSTSDISQSNPLRINKYLSLKTDGLPSLIVQKNWILVARSGQEILGSCFLVDDTYQECAVNEHSLRVIIDDNKIEPHYVFGFLSHPRIKDYIRAGIFGSAILTINEDYLEMIKVPILSDQMMNKISEYVLLYQQHKEEACKLEFEAINLIEKEIESWQK